LTATLPFSEAEVRVMATGDGLGDTVALNDRVYKWHEMSSSDRMVRLKRQHFEEAIEIMADEISLKEGRKKFSDSLLEMFNGCDSKGSKMKMCGDLDNKTVLVANFHCILDQHDSITVTYDVHTLSTDLPREGNRCPIKFGLDQRMIGSLVGESEIYGLGKETVERLDERSEKSLQELVRSDLQSQENRFIKGCKGAWKWIKGEAV